MTTEVRCSECGWLLDFHTDEAAAAHLATHNPPAHIVTVTIQDDSDPKDTP